ncbi:MAG: SDR family oxidoreductase [Anaerolineae bacterium]|nr:SDR family oxidoreductase [Anaerolineae bacterium]
MQLDLTGRVALVTGSAQRVGRVIALELARHGVNIMVHYHSSSPDEVRSVMQDIKSLGVDATSVQADISTAAGVEQIFSAIKDHFGRLNILVNSASVFQKRSLLEVTLEEWEQTMAVNLTAPFLCTQAAAAMMKENSPPGGAIINICDRGADKPWPEYAHHGISKAGLLALSEVSAVSLGPDIRVNAVTPGPVMKPARRNMSDQDWQAVGENLPLKQVGEAEDVARAVVYLARESFLTGTVIHVNGGEHLT